MAAIAVTALRKSFGDQLVLDGIGSDGIVALAWCAVITAGGYVWSLRLFNRDPAPR